MNKIIIKKVAQKGGMMVEALAMLGLIAVVTPTMYKKSAERTLEVEDINTATSMRSVTSAADSYVSSHYGELIQDMTANNKTEKSIRMADLKPYLPYGFNEDRLYDFDTPRVSVVRNGNNLTSFVLFPAKESADDGLGQERTVRIATLVGANGGYVNGTKTAKGIGGIWNLGQSDFEKVFENQNPNVYSIVTASSDAINNTNTEEDTDKFLYRTDGNGKWHNTMRSDLYMGGNSDDLDGYDETDPKSQPFSIRNVKSMIIGAEKGGTDADDAGNYGLFIANNTNPHAYIHGNLLAGVNEVPGKPNLVVRSNAIYALSERVGENSHHNMALTPGTIYYGYNMDKSVYDKDYNFLVTKGGDIRSSGSLGLALAKDGKWYGIQLGLLQDTDNEEPHGYILQGSSNPYDNIGIVSLINDQTFVAKGKNKNGTVYNVDYADRIVINNSGLRGVGDGSNPPDSLSYTTAPTFPVRVGSNLRVDGILGADQLDTQKFRAASIEVGSDKVDDANKWLKVNASGIHGENIVKENPEDEQEKAIKTLLEVQTGNLAMGTGKVGDLNKGLNNDNIDDNSNKNLFVINKDSGFGMVSTQGINITSAKDSTPIALQNPSLKQEINGKDFTISSQETGNESTSVKIKKTNFQVSDEEGKIILSVKGNDKARVNTDTEVDYLTAGTNEKANVAVHGDTLFTSSMNSNNSSVDRKYMKVGSNYDADAVVNIRQSTLSSDPSAATKNARLKQVLTVDGNSDYNESTSGFDSANGGTVYIRKGMIELTPVNSSNFSADGSDANKLTKTAASSGYGVINASRFVANNPNINNDTKAPKEVPYFVEYGGGSGTKAVPTYAAFNGSSSNQNNRYDTYMVNPAYTSVMHDIKLTTRGGARLSDILPDFINKGIYITSNTYKDSLSNLQFKFDNTNGVTPASGTTETSTGIINLGDKDSWASPYLGFVPAPQCPPGYNRLITLAPQSFMMSQAGQMQKGKVYKRGAGGEVDTYYTKNQVPEDSAFTEYNQMLDNSGRYITQGFLKVQGNENVDIIKSSNNSTTQVVTTQGGAPVSVKAKTQGLTLNTVDADGNTIQQNPYFLVSYGDTTPPLTIQQSTWLKTNVIPVGTANTSENPAKIGNSNTGYTKGWAAIMGFVYDKATYDPIITQLATQNLIAYDGSGDSVYWNIFPVRRNTLEAYATTYCYFDRTGIMNKLDNNAGNYIDQYNALQDYKNNNTWEKINHNNYIQRLNDPTLKYDEVW